MVKAEFHVIEEELSHQPNSLDVDRFGYLSAHYVVRLKPNRARLVEWRPYAKFHAEIQIRSVLQHAWSSISHALNYKQEISIPSDLQRRLNRIAGLFELADEEFVGIREQRVALRSEAAKALLEGKADIPISVSSVIEFIRTWPKRDLALEAAKEAGFKIDQDKVEFHYHADICRIAEKVGIDSIDKLRDAIDDVDEEFLKRLIDVDGGKGEADWTINDDFLAVLLLIRAYRDKLTLSDLAGKGGWDASVARQVLSAAKAGSK